MKYIFILLSIIFFTIAQINASEKQIFQSTKFDRVNVRKGPGLNYNVTHQFLREGIPLLVKKEFENWKMIEDFEKETGWVSKSQLSNKRYGIILNKESSVKILPDTQTKNLILLKNKVIFEILKCKVDWCKIKIKKYKGWIKKSDFWGVSEEEIF